MLNLTKMKLLNGALVSLTLEENRIYVLKGPNGCGKSLLLRSLALLHKAPYESYTFKTVPVENLNPQTFRKNILYVPPTPLDTSSTVKHYFMWPWQLQVHYGQKMDNKFMAEIQDMGFWEKSFSLLSSGEKQYIQVLRALSLGPQVLLLDEVTSHMDKSRELKIETHLKDYQQSSGATILSISHEDSFFRESKTLLFERDL